MNKGNARRMGGSRRLDAAESIYLQNQLTRIRARVYEKKYPNLKARTLVPVAQDVDPDDNIVKYTQFDQVGAAKIISAYADDLPRADVTGKEFTAQLRHLGSSYGYDLYEIRKSAKRGTNLPQRKANAARRAIDELIEKLTRIGDADHGILGLLNQPNALVYTVPVGTGGTTWTTKTGDEIIADMLGIGDFIVNTTNEGEVADTLLLPRTSYQVIRRKRLDAQLTVLAFFRQTSETLTNITTWGDLETAGAGSTRRMVAYRRDPDALELFLPEEFTQLEQERRGLEFVTDCVATCGGVVAYLPFSIAYGDGI